MPLDAGDVVRVAIRFSDVQGNDHVNVWHYEATANITDSDSVIRDAIRAALVSIYSNLSTNFSNTISEVDIKVDLVAFVGGVITVIRSLGLTPFTLVPGPSAASDTMPPGVAALVKFITGFGRTYGRKFIGMWTESVQNNGILGGAFQTQLSTFAAAAIAAIGGLTGGALTPGVMSEKYTSFVPFTGYAVSDVVAYQRRRRQGTGS